MRGCVTLVAVFCSCACVRAAEPTPDAVRAAVVKSLPLLQKGAAGHMANRTCFACHNQALPMLAVTTARSRGLPVEVVDIEKHLDFIAAFLAKNRDNYLKGKGQGGQADTAGYALWTLAMAGRAGDATTAAVAEYLLQRDKDLGYWRNTSNRPPSEASPYTTSYLALRSLQAYGTPEQQERIAERLLGLRYWLVTSSPRDTEDRVFRLWTMKRAGLEATQLESAAQQLIKAQRDDGGWSQLDNLKSDAYATGSALVALHEAAGIPTAHPAYQRGLSFLLDTQKDDGSWYVSSRSKPFQLYFETGFPHGKDQFISIAASGWAATALALALPPMKELPAPTTRLGRKVADLALDASWGRKATVVAFLSAECPVAAGYAPVLAELSRAYAATGVAFIGVHAGAEGSAAELARELSLPFPVVADAKGTVVEALGAVATPEVFVLDAQRTICYRGRIDDRHVTRQQQKQRPQRDDLREALEEVLAGRPVSVPVTRAVGCRISKPPPAATGTVTYHRDVAPILQQRCQGCHRPGEVAPFALMNYGQAARWADDIKEYTHARKMPPWKPVDSAEFTGDRRLSEREIATLSAWVDGGVPEGDPRDAPPPRRFTDGWQLGEPDLVLTLDDDFELGPTGSDVYRCFVLPTSFAENRHVSAVEVRPGNRRIVHHAVMFVDRHGRARKLEEQSRRAQTSASLDRGPGYSLPISIAFWPGFLPSGTLSGWAPGILPFRLPEGVGYRLPPSADVVLQLHYHRNGKVEKDRTSVGFYFTKGPGRHVQGLAVPAHFLTIPAGAAQHRVTGKMTLRQDVVVHTIMPHMHLIGKKIKVTMTPPDGPTRTLIAVDDWDFNWQENFCFRTPLAVKAGTRFEVEGIFDNSAGNPMNPFQPPRRIRAGLQTTDEMCVGFLGATSDRPGPIRYDVDSGLSWLDWMGGLPGLGL